jgi:hypothetical protein
MNSHTLTKTDINNEQMTIYAKVPRPNPKFMGKTLDELLKEFNILFKRDYGANYIYDGDSIEFVTQDFFKKTVKETVKEFIDYKFEFLTKETKI